MDLVLDGRGPLYLQLVRALRHGIASGRFPHGTRIPPTRTLGALTGLSRTTVVAAYQQLQAEGLLEPRVGDGSYVWAPNATVPRPASTAHPCPPQTAFAARAREAFVLHRGEGEQDGTVRYSFRYDALQANPTLPDEWARVAARVAPYVRPTYPSVQGSPRLRAEIAKHVRVWRGIDCGPENVLIVNGTRQAYSIATRVLLDVADLAAIEDPQYLGIRRVLAAEGVDVAGVPVDGEGMVVDALEPLGAKTVFVMPAHQFPSGRLLSPSRRRDLVDHANRTGTWIVEDDFGAEFRGDERATPSLYALGSGERVIHIGSFSRTMFPAMRVGYIIMPGQLCEDFIAAKALADFGVSPYEQEALAEFIASGGYAKHIRFSTRVLAARRAVLRQAMDSPRFRRVRLEGSDAGMHLVGWLDDMHEDQVRRLVAAARHRGLEIESIATCYMRPPGECGLILGLGALHEAEIPGAVGILGECLDDVAVGRMSEAGPDSRSRKARARVPRAASAFAAAGDP